VLTIVEESDEYIALQDGTPFSYTLYEREDKMDFKYTLTEKKEVNFNLIGPLNTLLLIADNDQEPGNRISTEGFITFTEKDIKNMEFTISVEKNAASKNKQIHFTLLASTTDTVIQLEPSVAHYETIKPEAYREYIF
jgi:hypothetical protein